MVECIRLLLYWPHTNALVAYNGGTSVGHSPVRTLFFFLSLVLFPVLAHWILAMALSELFFLSLILCLVPMAPCETMLYWPHTNALVAYNGGTGVGHGFVWPWLLFLSLILFPVLAQWMLAVALLGLFSWA